MGVQAPCGGVLGPRLDPVLEFLDLEGSLVGPTAWEAQPLPVGAHLRLLMCTHTWGPNSFCHGWGGKDDSMRPCPSRLQGAWLQISEEDLVPWEYPLRGGFLMVMVVRGRDDSISMGPQESPQEGKAGRTGEVGERLGGCGL